MKKQKQTNFYSIRKPKHVTSQTHLCDVGDKAT